VPQVCKVIYSGPEKMVRNEQATNCIWLSRPKLTVSWAAGFSFNKVRRSEDTNDTWEKEKAGRCIEFDIAPNASFLSLYGPIYPRLQCHADRKVPYDPHLPSLFDGEEYSKYARLWTR
jgi:hypothetical protein